MVIDYSIYAVTDRRYHPGVAIETVVEEAILGGVTIVQLREKTAQGKEFFEQAVQLKALTDRHDIPLIINDRIDIALLVGAGLHIGQEDIPLTAARRLLPNAVIGVSVATVEQAMEAEQNGASYLGVGSLFATSSKADADAMPYTTLQAIREAVHLPLIGIGGITATNVSSLPILLEGYAVISDIFAKEDRQLAAKQMTDAVREWHQSLQNRV
ncbi:thiamine phosphate synthase [Exiguobacterium acetylicum]|uniref:thiamine phosphate synthase n=1 Tax=Exiguobacterium sp. BMC-KP TaxID=1684312 RepID=UPI0006AA0D9C|nr:thiamine phosphate synthase [Exiguobacterium sp. BMC-KP]KOP31026.1 thiamine-phosphate pyrophosphorylase [Exiguobacterium sp. BMC-KP]